MALWGYRTYRHLFTAQVTALVGTGLATVALGLTAYRLAGTDAGVVLSTALAIKMVAYVLLAPLVTALADRIPRRALLMAMDLVRVTVAMCLPFITEVWQVYVLIAVLQAASAAFTPTFQAVIPTVLTDEADYTRGLSLSRLAYDLEAVASPVLAVVLLTVIDARWLFVGTAIGFAASAALVLSVTLSAPVTPHRRGRWTQRTTQGLQMFTATPRLRALLGINLAVASAGAMVLVNTVVIVRGHLGGSDKAMAVALGISGAGSMLAALALPRLLTRAGDRTVMLTAGACLITILAATATLTALAPLSWWWPVIGTAWAGIGIADCLAQTPIGRLIRRSGQPADLPALFAAQFTVSHLAWLGAYMVAGFLGTVSIPAALAALAVLAAAGTTYAWRCWPAHDPDIIAHVHTDLNPDHEHLTDAVNEPHGLGHVHHYVIDTHHPHWPKASTTRRTTRHRIRIPTG